MLNKLLSILLGYLLCCAPAWAQTTKIDSSEMVTLRIDPEASRGALVSQVFSEVKFIPLETTKESLFGSINQLKLTKDCYIIYDYDTKSVLIFYKDGKFRAKVNSSKMDADADEKEKQVFYGFNLIKHNDDFMIRISSGKNQFFFDLDGKLVKKSPVNRDKEIEDRYIRYADSTTIIAPYYISKNDKDSTNYNLAILNKDKEIALYFPFAKDSYKTEQFIGSGNPITDSGIPNELLYINYYDYSIYKIKPKALSLAYRIIFPASISIPSNFMAIPEYKNKRVEYFEKNKDQVYGLSNAYIIGDNLYFKANSWGFSQDKKNSLIYNLKTGDLTSIKNIEPDSLSQFLPVTDSGSYYDFANYGFHTFDNGYFYTSYSSLALFSFKDLNAGKNRTYNPVLTKYFETQNKKSNPVIIQLKPKQN
ncbi:6-bladed beta-propeller [Pedobacter sp. BMA]|uniref:6-bladed beta-propeller n=1 Tax=Pedobacter sp. BMA TaxID=1663685 RepID=UPI0006492D14|nr:6-bladed beta-propeller [Pedobacter sp. BMA]KLT66225.1 hypothetical protein AB669_08735 [Pedobacter sp. BMA]